MSRKVFIILFFACFGMTCEIFFVAFQNLINQTPLFEESLWSLTGKTYVWMFPIYALIPVLGKLLFEKLSKYPLLVRSLTYTTLIFLVEFSSGFLLEAITGKCPWEYTSGWHIMGYIRLDYTPAWMVFSIVIESLYKYLEKHLIT